MATIGPIRRLHDHRWLAALPGIAFAVLVGASAAAMGSHLRWIAIHYPLDREPVTVMAVVGLIAAMAMVTGLALLVSRGLTVGAWLFAFGVALVCGASLGFLTGSGAG
jgi:hypothetical protein